MNIIQAIHSPKVFRPLFRDLGSWHAWEVYLRGLFGLGIESPDDLELFRSCTGLEAPASEGVRESFVIAGRRSGKSYMSAVIASFLAAFKDWRPFLSPGERGWIFIIAVDKAQAGIIKSYISGIFNGNPTLKAMIAQESKESLELRNGVSIAVKTCSFRTIRGYTVLCAILEEMAFWRSEETGANPDKEVLAALRPALATVADSLLIGISTPYSRQGVLWDQFRQHYGKSGGPLVWRAPTRLMNPTIEEKRIEDALSSDRAAAKAEWEAEWRDDVSAFMPADLVEAVVVPGRFELPKIEGARYLAWCDPSSGRQDSMTLAIAHLDETSRKVILDVVRERRPPFQPEAVIAEFALTLKDYGVSSVRADRYAIGYVKDAFGRQGITVENSDRSASEIYLDFLPQVANGTVELLDNKRLVAQLTGLERRARSGGKDSVDHYQGGHDDVAAAAAGACVSAVRAHCVIGFDSGHLEDDDDADTPPQPLSPAERMVNACLKAGI
jgi:hypothetical protein